MRFPNSEAGTILYRYTVAETSTTTLYSFSTCSGAKPIGNVNFFNRPNKFSSSSFNESWLSPTRSILTAFSFFGGQSHDGPVFSTLVSLSTGQFSSGMHDGSTFSLFSTTPHVYKLFVRLTATYSPTLNVFVAEK